MKKIFKIVVLPTKNASKLFSFGGKLGFDSEIEVVDKRNKHLYVLSNEKVKDDDWFYVNSKGLNTYNTIGRFEGVNKNHHQSNISKIIATSDHLQSTIPSEEFKNVSYPELIPYLTDSFVKDFVILSNAGITITEVSIEVDDEDKIVVDSENFVNASKHKNYSRDDVRCGLLNLYYEGRLDISPDDDFDEWFEENIF